MSELKFTPGPWEINSISSKEGKGIAIDAVHPEYGNIEICEIWGAKNADLIDDEAKANANLIASAPDLLDALIGIREIMGIDWPLPEFDEARAAIAEAFAGSE